MGKRFMVETSIIRKSMNLGPYEGAPIESTYYPRDFMDLAEYVNSAREYFTSMVRFETDVTSVSILVRIEGTHYHITIAKREGENQEVRVSSN